jgi:hypothetical protein
MNEAQIRQRLRNAVGETRVPPDLRNRVEVRLGSSERMRGGSLMFGFGRTTSVANCITYLNAALAAYNAHDQHGMDAAITAAAGERDAFANEVDDIRASRQASVSAYTNVIANARTTLLPCDACQALADRSGAMQRARCTVRFQHRRHTNQRGDISGRSRPHLCSGFTDLRRREAASGSMGR